GLLPGLSIEGLQLHPARGSGICAAHGPRVDVVVATAPDISARNAARTAGCRGGRCCTWDPSRSSRVSDDRGGEYWRAPRGRCMACTTRRAIRRNHDGGTGIGAVRPLLLCASRRVPVRSPSVAYG